MIVAMRLKSCQETKQDPFCNGSRLPNSNYAELYAGGGVFLGMVLVAVALVNAMDVLARMVLVAVALVNVVDMARLVAVMLVAVALVNAMDVLARMVFVFVAFVRIVTRSDHNDGLLSFVG